MSSAAAKVPRLISISIIISMATVVVVSVIAAVIIWVAVLVIVLLGAHSTTFANFNIILSKLNRLIKNTINTVE